MKRKALLTDDADEVFSQAVPSAPFTRQDYETTDENISTCLEETLEEMITEVQADNQSSSSDECDDIASAVVPSDSAAKEAVELLQRYFEHEGINSGVMLMNLTRMRQFGWEERLGPLLQRYSRDISWGDQDLLNILFSAHPERLQLFSCRWNYRPDHCMYGAYCTAGPPACCARVT
ncbi:hypothetical protein HPB50_016680 [Hyalomma asiaticum]|uniref:Uncharacterized protein n=1 Tax=Hyalomma asiaticum TaxID=266040 RepID=A0ACB7T345_HYAAI|nr:hypothetical protein HPB50_016680 [Hyalomma asiaticum]